jgi:antitoxin component of MazEF toxin-antitoxin module
MTVRFRKWGNSLAVRTLKRVAAVIQAIDGTSVELTVKDTTVLRPLDAEITRRCPHIAC